MKWIFIKIFEITERKKKKEKFMVLGPITSYILLKLKTNNILNVMNLKV